MTKTIKEQAQQPIKRTAAYMIAVCIITGINFIIESAINGVRPMDFAEMSAMVGGLAAALELILSRKNNG